MGDLIEDRLLAYLWLKPMASWVLPAAAIAATLTIMIPLVVAPLTIAAAVSGVDDLIVPTLVSSVLAVAAYSGLFVTLGSRFSRALWWGLLYILVWENAIARIADGTARLAVRSYVVSILSRATDVDISLCQSIGCRQRYRPARHRRRRSLPCRAWILRRRDID